MNRSVFAGISALVVLLMAGCGPAVQSHGASLMGGPPERPCTFPSTQELALLASESDIVAVGTVDGAQVVQYAGISSAYTRNTLHIHSVLRGAAASRSLTIEEVGGVPMPTGPYVVFLVKTARTDGLVSYFLAEGLNGAFPVRARGVVRECPTFPATVHMPEASGSGVALTDFSDQIRDLPALPQPPHK
jgi:hypothetical protein